jgi:hypothetical protein
MRTIALSLSVAALACAETFGIRATVDFSRHVRDWDGFGVNYVEVAQTRDYNADPQEYGGFSILSEQKRREIIDLIFGAEGLKPGLLKIFLDPFHEPANDNDDPDQIDAAKFDHATTTKWTRYFAREGLKLTRARGGDLAMITTLYGPPAWTTKQRFVRGRDLDPANKHEVAEYIIAWAKYLRESERLPVKYIAFHNEGEDWVRWPADGSDAGRPNHDYNMYWPPEQVVDFLRFTRGMLDKQGMKDVGLAPGETSNWYRFVEWGYAQAIADDPVAMKNLGLIASHGFSSFAPSRWFSDWRSTGVDILREKRPELHAWVTSQSWSQMDVHFLASVRHNIYAGKVNGVIPWAAIQRPAKWTGGDPNPGTAIRVSEDGNYTIMPGYHFFKQVSRAGQPGMAIVQVTSNDSELLLMGFARKGSRNSEAFVVLNTSKQDKLVTIRIGGSRAEAFDAFRTSPAEQYQSLGSVPVRAGAISYHSPAGSATTFYAKYSHLR